MSFEGKFSVPQQQPPVGIDPQNIYKPPSIPLFEETFMLVSTKGPKPKNNFQEPAGNVYGAVYSGVPVYEMMCRNIAVMRRQKDSFLNATQVLKVAQIDKGKRTKILEKEIQNRDHEKVQGGYGKYQGTWIPFERGLELARIYGVDGILKPLFDYVPPNGRSERTPTKEQVLGQSNRSASTKKINSSGYHIDKRPKIESVSSSMEEQTSDFRDHHFATEIPLCDQFFNFNGDSKSYYNSYTNGYYPLDHYGHSYHAMSPPIQSPVALSATESSSERHRSTLMSLFIHSDAPANIDMLYPHSILPTDFDIDLILDEQGHTALHWAAALANIPLLTLLIQKGAQPDRLNFSGESALIRAVMVSHNHDALTFADLLNVLKDIICIPDKKNRTLLHHICLSSSVKGKNTSCSYYLQCLLDFIAKTAYEEVISSQLVHSDGQVSLSDRFTNLLNVPDFCGDTALNIAARLGNRTLFEQLIEAGADETLSNFAGLKPSDFGFTSSRESRPLGKDGEKKETKITSELPASELSNVYPSIKTENDSANSIGKEGQMPEEKSELQRQLAELSKEVIAYRNEIGPLKAENSQIPELKARISSLEKSLKEKNILPTPSSDRSLILEEELARLKLALSQQKAVESRLCQELVSLRASVGRHERSCKNIISVCCNVPLQNVEELIDPLMTALEADGFNLDVGLVSAFLARVRRIIGPIGLKEENAEAPDSISE